MLRETMEALVFLLIACFSYAFGSIGNESPFHGKCLYKCKLSNCTDGGLNFSNKYEQGLPQRLLRWSCEDECSYECMWKTVDRFEKRNYKVPQFYGKWPFVRLLGMQEPASTLFSLLNLYAHLRMFKALCREVRPDSPFLWMWYFYSFVCCHAWLWSAVFHAKDTEFTEFMDYSCALSIVMCSCYCMTMRVLKDFPQFMLIIISVLFATFFINHVAYLYTGRFDYGYNMQVNLFIGFLTAMGWMIFDFWYRRTLPYVWKNVLYVMLSCASALLEIVDVPPILWTFDFHSLWHLSTFPLIFLLFSFVIDDCKYLRKDKFYEEKTKFTK